MGWNEEDGRRNGGGGSVDIKSPRADQFYSEMPELRLKNVVETVLMVFTRYTVPAVFMVIYDTQRANQPPVSYVLCFLYII